MSPPPEFPRLFSPITLRGVTLRNRVVMLPMGTAFTHDGCPTPRDVAYLARRAQGGVGLIVMGGTGVHSTTTPQSRILLEAFRSECVPGFARVADAVHAAGAGIVGQLVHVGGCSTSLWTAEAPPWAPSAVRSPTVTTVPHEMSVDEIAEVVEGFAASAENLLTAGYDGIEIHGAHGYLVAQFMSPLTNQRHDGYGGSFANRMRFPLEVLRAIRRRGARDFILGFRLSATEEIEGGLTPDDAIAIARALRESGEVDYLSVAIGTRGGYVKDMSHPVGLALKYAAAIRDAVDIPVIASQRITHPTEAESALAAGQADLIGLGRALIADPDWVLKAREGRLASILPCVGCIQNCRSYETGISCLHNPASGRELTLEHRPAPAATRKRVVVIGAGPGGLEAARIAAERGHAVILYEREAAPGGQVRLAATAPHRAGLDGVVSFRVAELSRLKVDLRLGVEATLGQIRDDEPDAVVVATGAIPAPPDVEASEDARILTVWDLFLRLGSARLGQETGFEIMRSCVVVDVGEGLWESCNAAEALAEQGITVTIVTPARQVGAAIPPESLGPLYSRLRRHNVTLSPMTAVSAVARGWVSVYDPVWVSAHHSLRERQIEADLVVWCGEKRPDDRLTRTLAGIVPELYAVGDCVAPRRISHAVLEGHRAALSI